MMIHTIKKALKSNAFGRWLFPKIGFFWHLYKDPARRRALQKHGYKNLRLIMEIAETENLQIIPWAGTLLGFYRDGGFMQHDDDIDFAILPEINPKDIIQLFVERYGFEFNQALSYNGKIREFNLLKNKLSMDFFIMEDDLSKENFYTQYDFLWLEEHQYQNPLQNHVRQYSYPAVEDFSKITLNGVDASIPSNIEEELYYLYGKGWKTPDPEYKGEGRPGCLGIIDGYGYTMSYDDVLHDRIQN